MLTIRAAKFNLETFLMQSVPIRLGECAALFSATAVSFLIILWHTCLLMLSLPPFYPSLHLSFSPSLPLLLAFTCSLVSGEITTAQKRCPTACTATLCSAVLCLPPSTHTAHIWTHANAYTHMHRRHTVKYRRALKSTSTYTQRLHNPFPTPSINPLPDAAFCLFLLLCYPKQYTGTEQYRGLETLAASA